MSSRISSRIAFEQSVILESIATCTPLPQILSALARLVQGGGQDIRCGICVFDRSGSQIALSVGANLPAEYCSKLVGITLSEPYLIPCAMVAKQRKAIVSYDIANDDRWPAKPWRELALEHDLKSCRSIPIVGSDGTVCASFVLYSKSINAQDSLNASLADAAASLASIAIERENREAERRENEERLHSAIEGAQIGIWDWNLMTKQLIWSHRSKILLGIAPDREPSYDLFLEILHPDDREATDTALRKAVADCGPFDVDYRVRWADGSEHWITAKGRCFPGSDGTPVFMRGIIIDVDMLKSADSALREREERFRSMADATPVLVWMADLTQGCTYFNKRWLEFTGKSLEAESGHGWLNGVHPDDIERCGAIYSDSFERRENFQMEYRLRRHDGQFRWLLDCGKPLQTPDGRFLGFIGGCVDIHEQKELELRLRESEARARLAIEAAGMGFWEWSIDGSVKWSPEHNRLLCIDPTIANGTHDMVIDLVHPDDRAMVREAIESATSKQKDFVAEYRIFGPDRAIRWISAHGRPYIDEDSGKVVRMPGVVRDVTERRQAEDQLRKNALELRSALDAAEIAREHSEAASRTKDQFLAVLSHELRTPLTPVLMAVSSLRMDRSLPQGIRDSLDMIQRNIKLESRLIDDLLDLTRVARNKLDIHTEPMDLHDAVRGALDVSGPAIQANQMAVHVNLAANPSEIYGDASRLQQVFWNLIQNAVKFTPLGGSLTITSRNIGSIVRVDICDSGVGINPEFLHLIFDVFGADAQELPRRGGGVGLGLVVSKAVVDAHGGRLLASSDGVDKGTQLTVELATVAENTRFEAKADNGTFLMER